MSDVNLRAARNAAMTRVGALGALEEVIGKIDVFSADELGVLESEIEKSRLRRQEKARIAAAAASVSEALS